MELKVILFIGICCCFTCCNGNKTNAIRNEKNNIIIIEDKDRKVYFDTIATDSTFRHIFILKNPSCDTLDIFEISHSCECIRVDRRIEYICPYDKDSIIVSVVPNQKGYISRAIYIYFRNQISPIDLIVEGYVSE